MSVSPIFQQGVAVSVFKVEIKIIHCEFVYALLWFCGFDKWQSHPLTVYYNYCTMRQLNGLAVFCLMLIVMKSFIEMYD